MFRPPAAGTNASSGASAVTEGPSMGDPTRDVGNGTLLWFEVDDFDAAVARARELEAPILLDVHRNPNANHRELWVRDPDGYTVVISSPDGDAEDGA